MAVLYNYSYYYGNGDYYWGTGYTDATTALGYQQNPYSYTPPNETGSTGYYYIYNVTNLGEGVGTEGFVQVDGYYDVDSNSSATSLYDYYTGTPGYGAGYSGLGTELGYAYNPDFSNSEALFGATYYEADLTGIPTGRVTADNPSSPGPGAPVNLAPDPNEWNVSYDGDLWETATKSLNANNELVIQINDDPFFEDFETESYTLDLVNTSGLGFTQEIYSVNEGDGSFTIPLSSSGQFTTAKFFIQDDDWNNDFANAISLNEIAANGGFDVNFISDDSTNVGATKETGELNHAGNTGGASIWWSWTAPSSGIVQLNADGYNAQGSILDTTLGVYTGSSLSDLTEVASNDDDPYTSENGVLDSLVIFEAVADTTYYIAVDGYNGATGNVSLDLEVISFTADSPSSSEGLVISDFSTVYSDIEVTGLPGEVVDVDVTLSIDHTYDADLEAFLISPSGSRVQLFDGVGGDGDNFSSTTFDDEAVTSITSGAAPFIGSFTPTESLSSLDYLNPNGTWSLEIADNVSGDVGTLNNWSLTFNF